MSSDNNSSSDKFEGKNEKKDKASKSRKSGTTRMSAKIDEIGREAKAEFARVHEKDIDPHEETESDRDFELKLDIKEVKGSISLADIIKEKSRGGPKKWKIL